jgi:hypothetical protein
MVSRARRAPRANDATTDFNGEKYASEFGIPLFKIVQCEIARIGSIVPAEPARLYKRTIVRDRITGARRRAQSPFCSFKIMFNNE